MARRKDEKSGFSRRSFLRRMRWAPLLFLPAPIQGISFPSVRHESSRDRNASFPFADFRLTPHYPAKSPLEDVLSRDRKSTRLNSSHVAISYAVFCLKKKKKN